MSRALMSKAFGALMLCALAGAATVYPADKIPLVLALVAYGAWLWIQPQAWLLVLPALLPVLDLTPWTGWFFLEELDLLLLATAALGYWRLGSAAAPARLPLFFGVALGLFAASFALSAVIGVTPLTAITANSFSTYSSNYNSLRVAKGLAWALILLPLLRAHAGADLANLRRWFVPGMLLGLALACLAVVWERAVFPGLFNFSSDYRPTAPFSAMHTGGAALDAHLALSFPFVAFWLAYAKSRIELGLGLLLLLLGCYAGMTTFSRDVYLAYAVGGAVIGALALARRARRGALELRQLLGAAVLLAALAYALVHVFGSGGYRTLGAALALLGAAVVVGGARQRLAHRPLFAASAIVLALADTGLFLFLGGSGIAKGPYLAFVVSAGVFGAAALMLLLGSPERQRRALAVGAAAFACMALCTGFVAWHWGGDAALGDAALLIALALALAVVNRFLPQPMFSLNRQTLTLAFFCAIVFATLIPIAGSYYLGARFATVGDDFSVRLRHWSEAVDMMNPDWQTSAFGMGLGRYPDTYAWKNEHGEMPGSFSYETENDGSNLFLRLNGPQYAIGYGEVLRMLQHVKLNGARRYLLSVDVKRTRANAGLTMAVCERWLLYPQNCISAPLKLQGADGAWRHYEVALEAGALAKPSGMLHTPTQLEISTDGANAAVDIDNLSLRDPASGTELIRNGSFSYANDYWFFSSDRNHFPWHVKNFVVNTFFEQGWVGLIAMAMLLCYVAGDLTARGLHGETEAGIYLASLAGLMVVGLFDSLFDVPRLTLLFFLLITAAVMRPAAPTQRSA
jgi:hypothetical protein